MKLIGLRYPDRSGYYIQAELVTLDSSIDVPINFLIDTGCTVTTLSYFDFFKMGIDFNTLEQVNAKIFTANGEISVRKINQSVLTFNAGDFMIGEKLREIYVKPFGPYSRYDISLLGLDFLKIYHQI